MKYGVILFLGLKLNVFIYIIRFDGNTYELYRKFANRKVNETGIMVLPAYDYYTDPRPGEKCS